MGWIGKLLSAPSPEACQAQVAETSAYRYHASEVDGRTYESYNIGDRYEGFEVIDGLCDNERNVLILITREELAPWEE